MSASSLLGYLLTKRSQARVFQEVWDRHGRIDALCANAGIVDRRYVLQASWLDNC